MLWSGDPGEHCRDRGWGWQQLRAKPWDLRAGFQPCLWGGWSVWAWGRSQGVPKGPEVPQQLGIGICQWDISREQRHQCPNIYRNWAACLFILRNPKIRPEIPILRQSLEFFVESAREEPIPDCSLPWAWQGVEQGHFGMVSFCCTWWAHPKSTTSISSSW